MTRALNKLSATKVRAAPPGKYSDGGGLWLNKRPDGGAQWFLRVTVHGRRREMGLGSLQDVSLKEVRETAERWRAIARKGIRNILIHAGILDGEPELAPSVDLDMTGENCFLFSEHDGLFEPLADLGAAVEEGQPVAQIWPIDRTGVKPVEYCSARSGIVTGRHFPGLIKVGDCMSVIGKIED